jgi:hypothetical protein
MYLYVSEIFPTEIRPIGMGFSLFGQFACEFLLLISLARTVLTKDSNTYSPRDRPYGLQQCWVEVLPCYHLLVRGFYSR